MSRPDPRLRLHKTGQYRLRLNGKDHYLGTDLRTAEAARLRLLAERHQAGGRLPARRPTLGDTVTVTMILQRYVGERAAVYYRRPDGSHTNELASIKDAILPMIRLYGPTPADQLTTTDMEAVQRSMADGSWRNDADRARARKPNWSRTLINRHVGRIKRAFKWAVKQKLVPAGVLAEFIAVDAIPEGRAMARETEPVGPVDPATVAATLPFLNPCLRAMVELQLLSGMRPGEVCSLTADQIDRSGHVWEYRPRWHKMKYKGHDRTVMLGPEPRAVLEPWLDDWPADARTFSPARGAAARGWKPQARRRDRYSSASYATAVARACRRAGCPHWHPHQLRHTAADVFDRRFGADTARVLLGHKHLNVTRGYLTDDLDKARRAAGGRENSPPA